LSIESFDTDTHKTLRSDRPQLPLTEPSPVVTNYAVIRRHAGTEP
jgi:hypothetical protein